VLGGNTGIGWTRRVAAKTEAILGEQVEDEGKKRGREEVERVERSGWWRTNGWSGLWGFRKKKGSRGGGVLFPKREGKTGGGPDT